MAPVAPQTWGAGLARCKVVALKNFRLVATETGMVPMVQDLMGLEEGQSLSAGCKQNHHHYLAARVASQPMAS